MKLDYIADLNEYGDDVVRLFDFDRSHSIKFYQLIQEFLDSGKQELNLADIDFIEAHNCNLILRIAEEDEGIITDDKINFFCELTLKGYKQMLLLLVPFCKRETTGFQFLYDIDSLTDFLFAPGAKEEPLITED
ncbi:MAG: hypothetical protein HQ522_06945 [Bacteroidetes bacterium]|nr:hypothetical protein [Bacteroidota bacterium]